MLKGVEAAKAEIGIDPKQLKIDPTLDIKNHYSKLKAKAVPAPPRFNNFNAVRRLKVKILMLVTILLTFSLLWNCLLATVVTTIITTIIMLRDRHVEDVDTFGIFLQSKKIIKTSRSNLYLKFITSLLLYFFIIHLNKELWLLF